jgi:type IV secretory pathway VirB4 component
MISYTALILFYINPLHILGSSLEKKLYLNWLSKIVKQKKVSTSAYDLNRMQSSLTNE